tara:strand:+ start:17571 stop:18071 length:501 start_codon:yes stop_codon:yes gene_type:complete
MATIHYVSGSAEVVGATIAMSSGTDSVKPSNYYSQTGVFGSTPHDGADAQQSVSGQGFPSASTDVVMQRSKDLIPTSAVLINASIYPEHVNSINKSESVTTARTASAFRAGAFNLVTGEFTPGHPVEATDSFGNDTAARSSFAIPGSLTFLSTGGVPTSQNYPAKG